MKSLTIHYSATPEDVGALYSYALRHSWRFRVTLAAYAAFLGLIWLLASGGSPKPVDVTLSIIVAIVAFVLIPLVTKWRTKTALRTLSISPGGIETSIGTVAGTVQWNKVHAIWDDGQHIFVLRKNLNGFAIPTRAFADKGQREQFLVESREFLAASKRTE